MANAVTLSLSDQITQMLEIWDNAGDSFTKSLWNCGNFLSGLSRELNQTRLKSRSPETFAFRVGGLEFSEMGGCPKWRGVLNPSKNYAQACNFIKEETLVQVFSCEFCEIFKSSFFDRTPRRLLMEKLSQNCCEGLCNVPENAMAFLRCLKNTFTQIAITCSKPTMETAKKCVKCVQTIVTTPEPSLTISLSTYIVFSKKKPYYDLGSRNYTS